MSLVRVDCHLHTVASGDAVTTLDQLAERAAQETLDVVFITDHNEISAAAVASDLGVRVIVGEEIRTPDGDIIGLFLTERVPYVLPVAEVVARIRAQGGLVYAPHPFDAGRSSLGRVLPGLCAAGAVDIVEVFNAKIETQGPNERAAALATAYALPGGAGSDAHDPAGIGAAYLEMPDFDGPASFLAALADARITGEYRPHAPRYPRRPALQPDAGGQPLPVVGAVAEEQLAGLGPLEVQVGVVLPGEADAAVDLDVLRGHVEVRLRGVLLHQRGQHRDLRRVRGHRGRRVAHRRAQRLDLEQQVGTAVLDGLEAADGPVELAPDLGVLHRHVQRPLPGLVQRGQCGPGHRVALHREQRQAGVGGRDHQDQPGRRAVKHEALV